MIPPVYEGNQEHKREKERASFSVCFSSFHSTSAFLSISFSFEFKLSLLYINRVSIICFEIYIYIYIYM